MTYLEKLKALCDKAYGGHPNTMCLKCRKGKPPFSKDREMLTLAAGKADMCGLEYEFGKEAGVAIPWLLEMVEKLKQNAKANHLCNWDTKGCNCGLVGLLAELERGPE